jgi:hypothetical protein
MSHRLSRKDGNLRVTAEMKRLRQFMTGLFAGLRWGESAALMTTDIDWQRSRLHVQRTVTGRLRFAPPAA